MSSVELWFGDGEGSDGPSAAEHGPDEEGFVTVEFVNESDVVLSGFSGFAACRDGEGAGERFSNGAVVPAEVEFGGVAENAVAFDVNGGAGWSSAGFHGDDAGAAGGCDKYQCDNEIQARSCSHFRSPYVNS